MVKVSKDSKIKILSITPSLNLCGGIESYAVNYYKNMKNVQMDFITHDISDQHYKKLIENKGNRVFLFPKINFKNFLNFMKQLKQFFYKNHDYDIIHCHMANAGIFYFYYAKKYNIKVRILHSHQNSYADKFTHKLRNIPLVFLSKKLANKNIACSKLAGDWLFKNKNYIVVNNAIDVKRFNYNDTERKEMRKNLSISDKFVIGNVGRFTEQKNQLFLIDIFYNILKKDQNCILLLIGEGGLYEQIVDKINTLKIEKNVIILPPTNKIENYFQAMDVFVLPSLYEGLGIVNVEAQATGLKVIASTAVPKSAKLTDNMQFLDLEESVEKWSDKILECRKYKRKEMSKSIIDNNYDITTEAEKMEKIYECFLGDM